MTERNVSGGGTPSRYETVVAATDRVRWGPIIAGLFVALSTWAVLTVLGAAIGLSAWDTGDSARAFGVGASIWAAISAIVSFIVGGWIAARTAAVRGETNGLINGIMVWAVGIPLLFFFFGATLMPMAGRTRGPGYYGERAAPAAVQIQPGGTMSGGAMTSEQGMAPETRRTAAGAAWATLISLLLGLGSAALGGYLGARTPGSTYGETRPTV